MFHWSYQELVHHGRKGVKLDKTSLFQVMFSKDLQHVPIEFHSFSAVRLVDGSLNELFILFNSSLVNDGVRIHGGSLGSNVLPAKLQPLVKGDDPSGLEVHGVKHLLPGCILFIPSLVQVRISWSISISSWH